MIGYVISLLVGILCIALGVSNMRGNLSTIHSYHRHRVSQKDLRPFGKIVGIGTAIVGGAIALYSILSAAALYSESQALTLIATALLTAGLVVGLGLSFYAMIKYNKGIF